MKNAANIVTFDKSKHAKLRVKANLDYVHVKDSNLVAVTLAELGSSISCFPVVFIRNEDDKRFLLAAMLGLRQGENMQYNVKGWEANYVPLAVQRYPFVIGFDDRLPETEDQLTTCIDTSSPFLSEEEGIALVTPEGEETDFMKSRHQMMNIMFDAEKLTAQFTQKMVELDLLTPLELVLQLADGQQRKVAGLYTIDEVKLKNLSTENLEALHKLDFLPACYLILVSLYQLNQLIKLRNGKLDDKITNFRIEFGVQPQPETKQ